MKNTTSELGFKQSFLTRTFNKKNVAIVATTLLVCGTAAAADAASSGPSAADFDGLKESILTVIGGLGATAIAIMVASQGWTIALGIAKKFFNKAS